MRQVLTICDPLPGLIEFWVESRFWDRVWCLGSDLTLLWELLSMWLKHHLSILCVLMSGVAVIGCRTTESSSSKDIGGSRVNNFVKIPAGTFMMGSPATESGRDSQHEGPQHQVTISKGFELQATEVTQGQWVAVMGSNPSYFTSPEHCPGEHVESGGVRMCPNNPVEEVSWNMAQEFIQKLNSRGDGYRYRLPTEA